MTRFASQIEARRVLGGCARGPGFTGARIKWCRKLLHKTNTSRIAKISGKFVPGSDIISHSESLSPGRFLTEKEEEEVVALSWWRLVHKALQFSVM